VEIVNIDRDMKVYLGGGCNSIVLTSKDGQKSVVVDTKYFKGAAWLRKEIKTPNITLINTHFHMDHARGNRLYPEAFVVSGNTNWKQWDIDTAYSKHPDQVLNPGEETSFMVDDEVVHVIDMGRAHSPNDVVVFFQNRKVLAAGDLVWVNKHPVMIDRNVNIKSWVSYLDKLEREYDIQTVVPGHGKVSGKISLSEMKEYFLSISESISSHDQLLELKRKYKGYGTFPIFGCFGRTVKVIRRESDK
jgi:glyoxylase-like metal-dependent hydrolase (beta-lactamase superfamily II)